MKTAFELLSTLAAGAGGRNGTGIAGVLHFKTLQHLPEPSRGPSVLLWVISPLWLEKGIGTRCGGGNPFLKAPGTPGVLPDWK